MSEQIITASPPLLLLIIIAGWGLWMKRAGNFQPPADPKRRLLASTRLIDEADGRGRARTARGHCRTL